MLYNFGHTNIIDLNSLSKENDLFLLKLNQILT